MVRPAAVPGLGFAPVAARGIAVLAPEDLTRGNLTLELGLSLWMHRTGTDLARVRLELLGLRDALLEAAAMDQVSEPVPLLAGDPRTAILSLAIYLDGLIARAAACSGLSRAEVVEEALARL
ncbi:MAG: hypothetical protein ACLP9C_09490 [Acidimicrobiales bacterium]